MSLNFSIGLDSKMLLRNLKGSKIIDQKAISEALEKSAGQIEKRYKQLAKISKSGKGTGAYAEGIKVVVKKNAVFVSSPTRNELASLNPNYSPSETYYPAIQHYGSDARNIDPNPIILDALEQARPEAINKFKTSITKAITNATGKLKDFF